MADDERETEPALELEDGERLSEKPPDYYSLIVTDGEAAPISYEAVLAAKAKEQTAREPIVGEAPPSYIQLFGEGSSRRGEGARLQHGGSLQHDGGSQRGGGMQHGGSSQHGGQRRRHTRTRRRAREPAAARNRSLLQRLMSSLKLNTSAKIAFIILLLLVASTLPISMIVVGFVNYDVCQSMEVPLYLIVAGFILMAMLIFHTLLYTAQRYSKDESIYRSVRRCDFLAFLLFIWLLVGSNWMFRMRSDDGCNADITNSTVYNVTGEWNGTTTQITVMVAGGLAPEENGDNGAECSDCSKDVYVFTSFLILIQYIVGLCLIIFCCSKIAKKNRSS